MAKTLLLLIIAFVTLEFIISSVLSWLNTKWMTHPVPPELEGLYDEEKYRKQRNTCAPTSGCRSLPAVCRSC